MTDDTKSAPREIPEAIAGSLERVAGALHAGDVFGPAVESGDRIVVTASAIERAGGFGFGSGQGIEGDGGGGGGGGGSAAGRPVAAIEIGPDGVRIHPIIDVTRIGVAVLAALLALFGKRRFRP